VRSEEPARLPENWQQPLENFLQEAERLSATFERNLADKKNLSADLILKLDRRLSDYQALLKQTEASLSSAQKKLAESRLDNTEPSLAAAQANPAAPEVRALVLQMAKKGHSPEEIAAKAHLHLGEVELIIDLERQFSL
jgi:DNA-directed RNA polymerase specialized sigma24 family protein